MQTTAINGHPNNASKSQRVTCIHRLVRGCAIILGTFSEALPEFWVHFLAIPEFMGIIFWYNLVSLGIIQIAGY